MLLIIDNSEAEKVSFFCLEKKARADGEYKLNPHTFPLGIDSVGRGRIFWKGVGIKRNTPLAEPLQKFLKKYGFKLDDINALAVVTEVEGFTASRLAAVFGNALAFALKIPIISLNKKWSGEEALTKAKRAKIGSYITPRYSSGPHISGKKT